MKRPRHKVDEQEIMRFNMRRENEKGKTYTRTEFKELLGKMGYAKSNTIITAMTSGENPPFIRVDRGKYAFNPKPVHIDRLQKVWEDYMPYLTNRPQAILQSEIDEAVKLLKNNGYKVLRPITQYEEV